MLLARMTHFAKLKRMYEAAPCNRDLGPVIEIDDGRAEVRMKVRPEMFHAAGAVHGSYCFKLLDDAAFFAANSGITDVFVLTVSFNVQLHEPVQDGVLRATGRVVRSGRKLVFAESVLFGARGQEVARGSGVFARSSIRLDGTDGYA